MLFDFVVVAGLVCTVMRIQERRSGHATVNLFRATLTNLSTIMSPRCAVNMMLVTVASHSVTLKSSSCALCITTN